MKFVGDFHIHSPYSRATSKQLVPEYLDCWAQVKGVTVLGTGDFTHPGWLKELKEKLIPAEEGLFKLNPKYRIRDFRPKIKYREETRFLLTAEISTIYKRDSKVRKVHHLVFAPDFHTAEKIQQKLSRMKINITSDGRPIAGMDSRDLLETCLSCSEEIFFVPAHIWTPWFSALGDKSGFDSITQCYRDLSKYVYAVETGLSTDAPMHWMCSFLDNYTLISNSDAHSPEKLGRNANIFNTSLSYRDITGAMRTGNPKTFLGTIDLFPQEGKYHYDGHRKCGICWSPTQTVRHKGICPECGRKVTIGVMSRIALLSDRDNPLQRKSQLPFHSIIPLKELLAETTNTSSTAKRVTEIYDRIIEQCGPELNILLDTPCVEIREKCGPVLSEAIKRMRQRQVYISEGFDGEYGRIKVFQSGETKAIQDQDYLFNDFVSKVKPAAKQPLISFNLKQFQKLVRRHVHDTGPAGISGDSGEKDCSFPGKLNPEQEKAANHFEGPALLIAGPGTGKTQTLACRIINLIVRHKIPPEQILAITFTNKAAREINDRVTKILSAHKVKNKPCVSTFHSLGIRIISRFYSCTGRKENFSLIEEEDKLRLISLITKKNKTGIKKTAKIISGIKQKNSLKEDIDPDIERVFGDYQSKLLENNCFDLDDLIYWPIEIITGHEEIRQQLRRQYQWSMVDEYQDINRAQYEMITLLNPRQSPNLCVIGDPNQAIYGFRGADNRFILEFIKHYPEAKTYRLKTSYRCSEKILKVSELMINSSREKNSGFLRGMSEGVTVKISSQPTDKSEAEFAARTIEEMIGGLRFFSMDSQISSGSNVKEISSLSDFAILCRTKAQMPVIEKALRDHSIPYQAIGNEPVFDREPARSILDLIKYGINPGNKLLIDRLINKKIFPDGANIKVPPPNNQTIGDYINFLTTAFFPEFTPEQELLVKTLSGMAREFKRDFPQFLKAVELKEEPDLYNPNTEQVTLMTMHAAKGLEFNCVFITGCEQGLIPYSIFRNQKTNMEEERRLLYVGMTRAKKFLFLSHAGKRIVNGKVLNLAKSQFLLNIEHELSQLRTDKQKKPVREPEREQMRLF